jgi:hypothetical protein
MPIQRVIALLLTGATSVLLSSSNVLAEPLRQAATCPVASDDVVSSALGAPARLFDPDFGVTVNGSDTQCMFSAGGQLVLVRRTGDYFSDSAAGATPDNIQELRLIIADDLDYQPVSGVGDTALWATVHDRSLAPERMGVLVSKRGADAFMIGVMDTPDALGRATTLTEAVFAAQAGQQP